MQKVNAQLQGNLLNDALGDTSEVTDQVIAAHQQFCDFTQVKFKNLFEKAWKNPKFVDCPAHMVSNFVYNVVGVCVCVYVCLCVCVCVCVSVFSFCHEIKTCYIFHIINLCDVLSKPP